VDDVTREAVAQATGRALVLYPELLAQIAKFFARVSSPMTDNNRRQAYLPEGCIPIENPVGTAPAFIVEDARGAVITLPGVPRELYYLMEHAVVPYLNRRLGRRDVIVTRVLRTVGLGESRVDEAIADLEASANPTVGLAAHPGQTDVRIVAKAPSQAEAEAMVADFEAKIRGRLGAVIYATGDATIESVVADLLQQRGASLAVAETLTQGDISRRLGTYPDVFQGGIVAEDGRRLARLLRLDAESVAGEDAARALAAGVRQAWDSSYGVAVLADAPNGPWVAVVGADGADSRRTRFPGRDYRARTWTTILTLEFLRRFLLGLTEGWTG
jgi:nicotinamide mononucleotide (NMN) deamidase PncC